MAKNQVTITFAGDDRSLSKSLDALGSSADKTGSRFGSLHTGAKVLAGGILGGLAVAAKIGFDEFKDGEKSTAAITAALHSAKHASDITTTSIDDMSTSLMKKSGIDDDAIKHSASLALGFRSVRSDAGVFNNVMKDAVDISVKYGISTDAAAKIAAKAFADPVKGVQTLKKFGVELTDSEKDHIKTLVDMGQKTQAQSLLQDALSKSVGGSADAYGKTLSGQLDVAKQTFSNLAGSIIAVVMPAFSAVLGVVSDVVGWLGQHKTIATVLVGVLGTFAAAILAVNVATKAWAAVQAILNVALSANPIGLIVLGVAALAAGLILAWKKSETFRDIVKGAFDVVKLAVAPVIAAIQLIVGAFQRAYDIAKDFYDLLTSHAAVHPPSGVGVLGGARGSYAAPPGSGSDKKYGDLTAAGGIFSGAQTRIIGEAGPEAVIPLTRPGRAAQIMQQAGLWGGGGGGGNVYVTVHTAADATSVIRAIDEYERRNGQRFARAS